MSESLKPNNANLSDAYSDGWNMLDQIESSQSDDALSDEPLPQKTKPILDKQENKKRNLLGLAETIKKDPYHSKWDLYKNAKLCLDIGINLQQIVDQDLNLGCVAAGEYFIDPLREAGINIEQDDIQDITKGKQSIKRPEFENQYFDFDSAPDIVYEEHQKLFDYINSDKNQAERRAFYATISAGWNQMDLETRMQKGRDFATLIAKQYNLLFPFTIDFSDFGQDELWCGGYAIKRWLRIDDDLAKQLSDVGITTTRVLGTEVSINSHRLGAVEATVNVVAHEMFHAFQHQQAFLYANGYFETSGHQDTKLFPETPNLAKYYLASLQSGSYRKDQEDYVLYREQIFEDEAFEIGTYCGRETLTIGRELQQAIDEIKELLDSDDRCINVLTTAENVINEILCKNCDETQKISDLKAIRGGLIDLLEQDDQKS